jgi:hypothetical protein
MLAELHVIHSQAQPFRTPYTQTGPRLDACRTKARYGRHVVG